MVWHGLTARYAKLLHRPRTAVMASNVESSVFELPLEEMKSTASR